MKKRIAIIALSVFALGAIAAGCAMKNGDKKPDGSDTVYTITFVMPDGTTQERKLKKGAVLNSEDLPVIEIEGYEGAKWSQRQFDNVTGDLRITVDKTDMKAIQYTVNYDIGDGTTLAADKITYNTEYVLKTPVAPEGYIFYTWRNIDHPCLKNEDPSDDDQANVALKGVWKTAGANKTVNLKAVYDKADVQKITVTFVQTGQPVQTLQIEEGQKITAAQLAEITIAQDEGYETFEWDFDFENTPITEAVQINLKKPQPKTFTITYDLGGASGARLCDKNGNDVTKTTQSAQYLENIAICRAVSTDKNKVFMGWKVAGEDVVFANNQQYTFKKDITLVAQWRDKTQEEKDEEEGEWTGFY